MAYNLVTQTVVKDLPRETFTLNDKKILAHGFQAAVELLKIRGYCASERALADIGYPPVRARGPDGKWATVIVLGQAAT